MKNPHNTRPPRNPKQSVSVTEMPSLHQTDTILSEAPVADTVIRKITTAYEIACENESGVGDCSVTSADSNGSSMASGHGGTARGRTRPVSYIITSGNPTGLRGLSQITFALRVGRWSEKQIVYDMTWCMRHVVRGKQML